MNSPALARQIVAALIASGVQHVVVAPGSRNAPLSMAFFAADAAGSVHLHVRIDERSAGFLALGIALATQTPVAVITTSGTAVGNLLPAVMEADESGVPLVVVSADRPGWLVGTGANQTTRQRGLFGVHTRGEASLASGDAPEHAVNAVVQRLVAVARGVRSRQPGPVQLNVELTPPLVDELPPHLSPFPALLAAAPLTRPTILTGAPRTVILAGAASVEIGRAARNLAEQESLPLLAEPSSNARYGPTAISTYRLLLSKPDLAEAIERVIVFGRPTLSRPQVRLLSRPDIELIVVSDRADWVDPGQRASHIVDAVALDQPGPISWLNQWRTGDHVLRKKIELLLDADSLDATGLRLAQLVTERVVGEQCLVFGSSNPIRDADLAPISDAAPAAVFANRGLAGIDGTISTAAGICLGTGLPTTCLLGDLTAMHDVGGLWLGDLERRPALRLVLLDDRGGAIFHTLEQGGTAHADSFERVFGTPHSVNFAAVARGFGWSVVETDDLRELGARLRVPPKGPEVFVIRAPRGDRRALNQALNAL